MTSEEVTARRRAERKQFKLDRARAVAAAAAEAEAAFAEGRILTPAESTTVIPSAATWKPSESQQESPRDSGPPPEPPNDGGEDLPQDLEHLQLTLQEAFFLAWNFDCLAVLDPDTVNHMLRCCTRVICSYDLFISLYSNSA